MLSGGQPLFIPLLPVLLKSEIGKCGVMSTMTLMCNVRSTMSCCTLHSPIFRNDGL